MTFNLPPRFTKTFVDVSGNNNVPYPRYVHPNPARDFDEFGLRSSGLRSSDPDFTFYAEDPSSRWGPGSPPGRGGGGRSSPPPRIGGVPGGMPFGGVMAFQVLEAGPGLGGFPPTQGYFGASGPKSYPPARGGKKTWGGSGGWGANGGWGSGGWGGDSAQEWGPGAASPGAPRKRNSAAEFAGFGNEVQGVMEGGRRSSAEPRWRWDGVPCREVVVQPLETWLGRGVCMPSRGKPMGGCRPSWRVCQLPEDLQNSEGVGLHGPDTLQGSSVVNSRVPGVSGVGVGLG